MAEERQVYRVTGDRPYRGFKLDTVFELDLSEAQEERAIDAGFIEKASVEDLEAQAEGKPKRTKRSAAKKEDADG